MIRKKWMLAVSLILMIGLMFGSSALAFEDLSNHAEKDKVNWMKERGLISGFSDKKFHPDGKMTYAQGVQLIVKGLGLNIDNLRFVKEPKASDYYKHVSDNAWYAQSFIIAQFNLGLPSDVKPNDTMTREQFAHYLYKGMMRKGEFAFIEIFMQVGDEDQIAPAYKEAVQKLLITKVAELDDKGNFRPKQPITRADAAVMTYNAIEAVKKWLEKPIPPVDPDVRLNVEKVNDDINKVTISWGEKPNTGYGITIDRVEFGADGHASIVYSLHYPNPDTLYAQVITEPKAVTYIASTYTPALSPNPDQSASDAADPEACRALGN